VQHKELARRLIEAAAVEGMPHDVVDSLPPWEPATARRSPDDYFKFLRNVDPFHADNMYRIWGRPQP
jgi:hypothetical protein